MKPEAGQVAYRAAPERNGVYFPRGSRYHNGNFYSPLDKSLVDWSVVPEPATLALVCLGIAGALLRRRHR